MDCPPSANLINVCWADVDTSLATLGAVQWTALDNCDENLDVSYTYSDELEFDCGLIGVDANPEGSYNFTRTFEGDGCGLQRQHDHSSLARRRSTRST